MASCHLLICSSQYFKRYVCCENANTHLYNKHTCISVVHEITQSFSRRSLRSICHAVSRHKRMCSSFQVCRVGSTFTACLFAKLTRHVVALFTDFLHWHSHKPESVCENTDWRIEVSHTFHSADFHETHKDSMHICGPVPCRSLPSWLDGVENRDKNSIYACK